MPMAVTPPAVMVTMVMMMMPAGFLDEALSALQLIEQACRWSGVGGWNRHCHESRDRDC
jgi:hypothetical protein